MTLLRRAMRRAEAGGMDRETFADQVLEVSRWTLWRVLDGRRELRGREVDRLLRYLAGSARSRA